MTDKKTTTLSVDPELVKRAKNRGLNISGVCDYALREMLDKLENTPEKEA
jgi:post-segregation antitoxin (ccd killing protein)